MLYICIFSNKFDLKQTIRVLHTGLMLVVRPVAYPRVEDLKDASLG